MHFRHKWVPVKADVYQESYTFARGSLAGKTYPTREVTLVLRRCSVPGCTKSNTEQLEGEWTLEQLTKEVR